ncbi:hypothetical protein PTTG_28880 [Puccinia triticina 1-1 BBBD Race 1]|uniref:RING-type domain-containing protein n=2 Tax=Puccinia triticina TaxID=208348 RepID=A0A180G870_PUCT1|nr:uncharacterized protein PtA15_15A316 [Puccinia triticina]OAV88886.1 hypothetical protein PTTG_28880 [Puccinia triticina 1-1 BBBD Race 1]WAQ91923.1 hypothetical protein PtA15_15A316 [Puccinia triticina]WAR62727.1 hypothetical protein PtB15_15B314 [Puccinia triticina]
MRRRLGGCLDPPMSNAHPSATSEAASEEFGDQSVASEAINEQPASDPFRPTITIQMGGYLLTYIGPIFPDPSHNVLQPQELEARILAFNKNTIILGYMPYNKQLKIKSTEQVVVSLDQALHLLVTTEASQHGESDALADSHHAGGGLERANSKSKDLQHQQNQAYSCEDMHLKTNNNHKDSSTSNPTNKEILDVIVGNKDKDACGICLGKFKSPTQDAENQWSFSKAAMIRQCKHYFHPECIKKWLVEYRNDGCPNCRVTLTVEAQNSP